MEWTVSEMMKPVRYCSTIGDGERLVGGSLRERGVRTYVHIHILYIPRI